MLDAGQLAVATAQVPTFTANARVDAVPNAAEIESSGTRLLNASSDDLLGFAVDPRVREAASAAVRKLGVSAQPTSRVREELEGRLASLLGTGGALVVRTPTPALRLLARLAGFTYADRRTARAPELPADQRYGSADELERALQARAAPSPLLLTDALHRAEGDVAALPRLVQLAAREGAVLVVLERVGPGVLGPNGAGAVEHLALASQVDLHVLSLAGALAGDGWVLGGSRSIIDALRPLAGEGPTLPALAACTRALELLAAEPQRRARLFDVTQRLVDWLRSNGFDTGPTVTPWIPVWLGDGALAERWLRALADAGVFCRAWLAPDRARLLLSLPATLTESQLDAIVDAVARIGRKLGVSALSPAALPTPVALARPQSFVTATPCHPRWHEPQEVRPEPQQVAPPPSQADRPLGDRLFDAVETLTWRAANVRSTQLRRLLDTDTLRSLIDRARGK